MVEHTGFLDKIGLPRSIHFRIVVGSACDARTDDMSLVFQTEINERSITLRSIVFQVGSTVTLPQQEAHRNFAFEFFCRTAKAFERECLENDLTVGITDIYFIILIERFAVARFGNDVPTKFVKFIVNALFKVRRVQPRLFEFNIDTRTVACILRIIHIFKFICQTVAGFIRIPSTGNSVYAFTVNITLQHFSFGVTDLVFKSRDILVLFGKRLTSLLNACFVKPTAGIECKQLLIHVRHCIVRAETCFIRFYKFFGFRLTHSMTHIERLTGCRNQFAIYIFNISGTLQVVIVIGKDNTVLRTLKVGFEVVHTHFACPAPGRFRFFRSPESRTAVSHYGIRGYVVAHFCHFGRDCVYFNTCCIVIHICKILIFTGSESY